MNQEDRDMLIEIRENVKVLPDMQKMLLKHDKDIAVGKGVVSSFMAAVGLIVAWFSGQK